MTDDTKEANIYPADSTKALLGLAFALIHEIKHHQGYDGERFAKTLKAVASGLTPETPGLTRLMKTFDLMITQNVTFENADDGKDKS